MDEDEEIDLNLIHCMDHESFVQLAKELEAKRVQNLPNAYRMQLSKDSDSDAEVDVVGLSAEHTQVQIDEPTQVQDDESAQVQAHEEVQADEQIQENNSIHAPTLVRQPSDEEFEIERWLRIQRENEALDVGTGGRLTAPQDEVRHRRRQSQQRQVPPNSGLTDTLRTSQINLVEEQIYLQQILQENARIAQEEALAMAQLQRRILEIDLEMKQKELQK